MKMCVFTIVLSGESELDEALADRLFAAGCEDGSPGSCNRIVSVDFHREANSLEEAIRSAIANVQTAGCTVTKVEIAPDAEVLQI